MYCVYTEQLTSKRPKTPRIAQSGYLIVYTTIFPSGMFGNPNPFLSKKVAKKVNGNGGPLTKSLFLLFFLGKRVTFPLTAWKCTLQLPPPRRVHFHPPFEGGYNTTFPPFFPSLSLQPNKGRGHPRKRNSLGIHPLPFPFAKRALRFRNPIYKLSISRTRN